MASRRTLLSSSMHVWTPRGTPVALVLSLIASAPFRFRLSSCLCPSRPQARAGAGAGAAAMESSRAQLFCCAPSSFLPLLLLLLLSASFACMAADFAVPGVRTAEGEEGLFPEILRDEAVQRIKRLGKISDSDDYLERTFMSPASKIASNLIINWMQDAGLQTWIDQMGNVHGRTEAANSSAGVLLIGSHMDTVIDAGMYDGSLGIICAISALKILKVSGKLQKLKHPVEIIAFSDEEGVRFQSTFLGSAALAGVFPVKALRSSDKSGMTVQDVLQENSLDVTEESIFQMKYNPEKVWGYVEMHIEQGPVLEFLGRSLGAVKGIAGQSRLKVTVRGSQGHAGTVPMHMRQDPMAASAELIVLLESLCKHPEIFLNNDGKLGAFTKESLAGLVCTVGEISSWPSASNVIPGQVTYTIDVRSIDDSAREAVIFELSKHMYQICDNRNVHCTIENKHSAEAVHCDPDLTSQLKLAAHSAERKMYGGTEDEIPLLMSGAGHDAMAMSHLTKVGMLFVRCREGISHSPKEFVSESDVWMAGVSLLHFLENM